jgi:hypothetical protein
MLKTTSLLPMLACLGGLALTACGGMTVTIPSPFVVGGRSVHLEGDVAAGYAAYHAQLDGWGTWAADSLHGVHWCPSPSLGAFQPYRTDGHWQQAQDGSGTPEWHSNSGMAWESITLHHGWWGQPDEEPEGSWCWVPGAEATAARVVWREGDGFVGWAPEPTDGDYCQGDEDTLSWTYELLGALFEDALDRQVLTGDAANQAAQATTASGKPARHGGPTAAQVGGAHSALAAYARGLTPPAGKVPVIAGATAQNGAPQAGAGGGGSKSSEGKKTEGETTKVVVLRASALDDDELPPAAFLYSSLVRQPIASATGPTPHFYAPGSAPPRVAAIEGTSSSWGRSSDGGSFLRGSGSAFSREASGSSPSRSYASSGSSHGSSSSHSSSSSSHASSSSHSSSSHHR